MTDEAAAIVDLIAAGDDQAAYARLRARLAWPRGRELDASELPRWLALLAQLATRRGSVELADLTNAVVRDPDSPDRLYELGYAMIDAGAPAIAASVLWRCLALVPNSEEVVCELVSALESALAYPDAFKLLEEHAGLRAHSYLVQYLYGFNAAMAGKLDITRTVLGELVPTSPETIALRDTLAGIITRADQVRAIMPLDERDLRGWHYVLTGSLLTHQSPYGFDDPMHGRYAWLQDSLPRVATGIARLAALVGRTGVDCIYAPPGRSNEILARAISTRLDLPIAPWPAVGVPAPGLIVLYDLADLQAADVGRLVQRRPDQIVFAHASPWTVDSPIAPDITTLLYQTLVPPWGASVIVDPATQEVATTVADERTVEAIAAELAAHPGLDPSELIVDEPERWDALVAATWPVPASATRSRMWAGGPVSSSRFI